MSCGTQPAQVEPEIDAHLELQIRHHRREVAIAHALAVAVDRPLHLHRARAHRGERVRDADTAVVVRVDADRVAERRDHVARRLFHKLGQIAAIRLAQHHEIGASAGRRLHSLQ